MKNIEYLLHSSASFPLYEGKASPALLVKGATRAPVMAAIMSLVKKGVGR